MGISKYIVGVIAVYLIFSLSQGNSKADSDSSLKLGSNKLVGADGHALNMAYRVNATDVTYQELINFIIKDKTDEIKYDENSFICADYAEKLQNNAEANNIRCGYVWIHFENKTITHLCNIFNTTDKGRVYIDCTKCDCEVPHLSAGKQYKKVPIDKNYTAEPMGIVSEAEIKFIDE